MNEVIARKRTFGVHRCAHCHATIPRGSVVFVLRTRHRHGLVTHAWWHLRCPVSALAGRAA
ncbi:MAG TPA: hypothetical protein VK841_07370 [Polyangiaceae bacterium]|nr:hypothetical protein [Polyangiaceae bacterium]